MKNNDNKVPFYKKNKFKFNTVSTTIIVVFMVCLVAFNVLASVLSDRFTAFSIDMTSSSDYTISKENREYIKKIDKPVTIILTCTEDYYLSSFATYISQYYTDKSGGKYFNQTVELLKNYKKINPKIDVKFVDAQTPDFNVYKERYADADISVGDIIVDYTYDDNGVEKTKYKVLAFEDLYTIEEVSDYESYTSSSYGSIGGSSVETAVTSALFFVTKETNDKIALLTGYGSADVENYVKSLDVNGYEYVKISDLTVEDIPEDATMLMIASPSLDLSQSDVKKIDEFLLGKPGDKDFKYNRTLIYLTSDTQFDTPNLDGLLEEWGIVFEDGTVYETDDNKHASNSNEIILLEDTESEFTTGINANLSYISEHLRPMKLKFEASGKFNTYEIIKSSETCVVKPYKASSTWDPNAENMSSYSSVVLSRYATEDTEKDAARFSNVLAVASVDFIGEEYSNTSYLANDSLMLSLINTCAGRISDTYEIENKKIDYSSFTPTQSQSYTIFAICVVIIPVLTVAMGIVLFVIRKRR